MSPRPVAADAVDHDRWEGCAVKFQKVFKQNRMATEWGPVYPSTASLPYPIRVKRGVLDQLVPALRLAGGNPKLRDTDANRVVAGLVEQNMPRLQALLRDGSDIAQFQVAMQTPLPLVLHLVYGEKTVWVSDHPLLPYPPPREEEY
jgi:hypothetical protein